MRFEKRENAALRESVLCGVHESGLRVYVVPKKGFCKYYAIYGTEYGSVDTVLKGADGDVRLPDGIAHFLEHKLFEEEDGKNAFDKFALTGASSNAFTSFDMTAYLFSCTDSFYENLEILLEFVNNPYFTDENVAKEQGIIGQEIKMYDDDPSWRLFFNMLQAMYEKNPVRVDIAGTVESISHITPELLYECCRQFYNPSNMFLVIVGDVDEARCAEYIDKYVKHGGNFGRNERVPSEEPETAAQSFVSQKMSVSKPMFLIGFKEKKTGVSGAELFRKQIVTKILTELLFGRSTEFFMELYSEGLIDGTFDKDCELEKSYGFSSVSGESNDPKAVLARVLEYVEKMKTQPLSDADIDRAKKILIGKELRKYNSVESIGNDFIRAFMNGFEPMEYSRIVREITADELSARLAEHFDRECCVLSVVEPK